MSTGEVLKDEYILPTGMMTIKKLFDCLNPSFVRKEGLYLKSSGNLKKLNSKVGFFFSDIRQ